MGSSSHDNGLLFLVFFLGTHKRTKEPQWQCCGVDDGNKGLGEVEVLFVPEDGGMTPSEEQRAWGCRPLDPIFVSDDLKYRIVPVRLVQPFRLERELLFMPVEHKGRKRWECTIKKDGITTLFVVNSGSGNHPSTHQPMWICDMDEAPTYENRDGSFQVFEVFLKEPVDIEVSRMEFEKEIDEKGRERFVFKEEIMGVSWRFVVDRRYTDRVSGGDSGDTWLCMHNKQIFSSSNGLFRVITVIPIEKAPEKGSGNGRKRPTTEKKGEKVPA